MFATISGAHLYGFPSPDSDFDLRGSHILPLKKVAGLDIQDETISDSRVIEALEMDIVSHDIRKFFKIGGENERRNLDLVQTLCALLDELSPRHDGRSYREQITFVTDRPGHDRRYAMNISKIRRELGWTPVRITRPASAKPSTGTWKTARGGKRSSPANTGSTGRERRRERPDLSRHGFLFPKLLQNRQIP